MVLELVGIASQLLGGILGNEQAKDTAEEIRKQQLKMPRELQMAEAQARELSQLGMPGYETYKEQARELMPTTLNQAKDLATSPSSIIDMASKSLAATNRAYNDLAVRDAQARLGNMQNYQNVLMQKGAVQTGIDQANIQTNLAALAQEAQGTKDLWQGITNAAGSAINVAANQQTKQYQDEYLKMLSGYFNQGSGVSPQEMSLLNPSANYPVATFGDQPQAAQYGQVDYNKFIQELLFNSSSPVGI